MEQCDEGRNRRGKRKMSGEEIAAFTRRTLNKIDELYPRERVHRSTICTFHDMTCTGYGWLLPGWVAEERHVPSGRVYRYYYDPNGTFYETQHKVLETYEKAGLIVIDK